MVYPWDTFGDKIGFKYQKWVNSQGDLSDLLNEQSNLGSHVSH